MASYLVDCAFIYLVHLSCDCGEGRQTVANDLLQCMKHTTRGGSDPCCLESIVLDVLCFWETGSLLIGRRELIPSCLVYRCGGTSQRLMNRAERQDAKDLWATICLLG